MKYAEKTKKKRNIASTIGTALILVLSLIGFAAFFAANWYLDTYGDLGFDSVLFTLMSSLGGVQSGLVTEFIKGAAVPALLCWIGMCAVVIGLSRRSQPGKIFGRVMALVLSLLLSCQAAFATGLPAYLYGIYNPSELFESYYVDPAKAEITFPEEKRNLIYIFLESMETTYFSRDLGGAEDVNLIPELYALAQENLNFSEHDSVGGFRSVNGTTWTIGAMVGQTAGVPLKTPDDVDDWQNGYGKEGVFLPGLTNLSDVLHENGYYQALMVGSVASFGGRETYYETHGTDRVYGLKDARADGIVPGDYFVWWGIEDKYLFEYAKQEITEIAAGEQPFAFTMLTVDTHHIGGYVCEFCGSDHEEQYENVISCSSKQVLEFVKWIQDQDFYENTTVIICGDHPSMDNGYFERNVDPDHVRRIYNCFINSAVDTAFDKNRNFTTLDLFPTTLAAMGCEIEGEMLGLGTNLFSGAPTLAERLGFSQFDTQVAMSSDYYAEVFRQEDLRAGETTE